MEEFKLKFSCPRASLFSGGYGKKCQRQSQINLPYNVEEQDRLCKLFCMAIGGDQLETSGCNEWLIQEVNSKAMDFMVNKSKRAL